ncbi:hypothetical protein PAHAL_2G261800 [Panicum hallii]|uniref:Secreted protein n=1 Tax=Panicum hallii TaxID=206008 RepID=A0A2S3GZI5_9POAL|nr:hypothetical protein PAHAL_2G261800 [Panicum hallii]
MRSYVAYVLCCCQLIFGVRFLPDEEPVMKRQTVQRAAQILRQPPWKMVIDDGTAPSFSFVQTAGDRSPCLSRVFDRATGGRAGRRGPCFRGFSVRNSLLPCSNRPVRRTQRSARGTRTGGGAYRGTVGAEASMYRPTRRCVHAESPGNRLSLFWLLLVIDAATVAKL